MKKLIIIFIVLSTFSSCMVIGPIVGGKKTTSEKEFSLNPKSSIQKSKDALKQVVFSNGYIKLNETESSIQFKKKSALMGELMMSRTKTIILTAKFSDNNVTLEIVQSGNFKTGTTKKVEKTFIKIKNEFEKL